MVGQVDTRSRALYMHVESTPAGEIRERETSALTLLVSSEGARTTATPSCSTSMTDLQHRMHGHGERACIDIEGSCKLMTIECVKQKERAGRVGFATTRTRNCTKNASNRIENRTIETNLAVTACPSLKDVSMTKVGQVATAVELHFIRVLSRSLALSLTCSRPLHAATWETDQIGQRKPVRQQRASHLDARPRSTANCSSPPPSAMCPRRPRRLKLRLSRSSYSDSSSSSSAAAAALG